MSIYTPQELSGIDISRIPNHIAIIPDGNRRWAKKQKEGRSFGHSKGANAIIETIKAAKELGVKTVTFYLFSTENWNRSRLEISTLMLLFRQFLDRHSAEMLAEGVSVKTIGDIARLPKKTAKSIQHTCQLTSLNKSITMVLAFNYGARDEMCRAVQKIIENHYEQNKQLEITENLISQYLDTAPWGDPELFIRSSGEMRLSNFLLWQLAYSEIYVTETLWPDFNKMELLKAIATFQSRKRRFGGK